MFGKLLFFFVFPKLGISYKVKKWLRHFIKNLQFFVNLYPSGDGISYKVKNAGISPALFILKTPLISYISVYSDTRWRISLPSS